MVSMGTKKFQLKKNKTLVVGTAATPTSADPDFGHSYMDSQLYTNMHDTMIKYKAVPYPWDESLAKMGVTIDDGHSFLPNLCESWSNSPDQKTVSFKLRTGVKGHWGNEVTTADTIYTINRGFEIKASMFFLFSSIAGLLTPKHCRVIDKYTFEFNLPNPTGMTLKLLCLPWVAHFDHLIAEKKASAKDAWALRWLTKNSCSWGPYRIKEWKTGEQVTLEASDDYWQGEPKIGRVICKAIPERSRRVALLERGRIDIADLLLPQDIEYLRGKRGIKIMSTRSNGVYYLLMNCQMKPFDDIRVRRAMNYACPQQEIVSTVFHGLAEPMNSPCSPLQPGYTGEFWQYDYNPDTAARLLVEAGYPKGFEVGLFFTDNSPAEEEVCVIMRKALKKIKVDVKLRKLSVASFNRILYRKKHLFASRLDFPAVRDPTYWGLWFKSHTFLNYQDLRDAELDNLLDEQASITDMNGRMGFSKKVQKRILDLAPMVFIAYPTTNIAMRTDIGGKYHVNPDCISYYWRDLEKA